MFGDRDDAARGAVRGAAELVVDADEAIFQLFDGRFTHVNRAAERMFGYSAVELIGRSPMMFVPADRAVEIAEARPRVERGETVRLTSQRLRRDGTALDVSVTLTPIRDANGNVVGHTATMRDISELVKTERRLRELEANLRAMVENVPCGMSLRGRDGRYLHVNRVLAEALGSTPEELVGRDPAEQHNPAITAVIRAQDQEMALTGRPAVQESRITHPDGSAHDYIAIKYPVFDETGVVRSFGAFSLDITDRKRAEQALLAAERRLARLVEAAPDALLIVDSDGVIVEVNSIAQELFGWPSEELVGRPAELLVASGRAAEHRSRRRSFFAHPRRMRIESDACRRDGSDFPVEVTMNAMRDDDGRVLQVTSVRDITERRRARAEHDEALERFKLAFDSSPVGMVLLDLRGRYERVNEAFCVMVGYSREQLLGTSFEMITHPDDITPNVNLMLAALGGERSSGVTETRYIHAAGHEIHTRIHTTLLCSADTSPVSFLAHIEDVTAQQREQLHLSHLADHDALTGLLNRGAFERALAEHALAVERYGPYGSVLVIALDAFRSVNDELGHFAGDQLLIRAASRLKAGMRRSDVLARSPLTSSVCCSLGRTMPRPCGLPRAFRKRFVRRSAAAAPLSGRAPRASASRPSKNVVKPAGMTSSSTPATRCGAPRSTGVTGASSTAPRTTRSSATATARDGRSASRPPWPTTA